MVHLLFSLLFETLLCAFPLNYETQWSFRTKISICLLSLFVGRPCVEENAARQMQTPITSENASCFIYFSVSAPYSHYFFIEFICAKNMFSPKFWMVCSIANLLWMFIGTEKSQSGQISPQWRLLWLWMHQQYSGLSWKGLWIHKNRECKAWIIFAKKVNLLWFIRTEFALLHCRFFYFDVNPCQDLYKQGNFNDDASSVLELSWYVLLIMNMIQWFSMGEWILRNIDGQARWKPSLPNCGLC